MGLCAVVASAGSTNAGAIDDLAGIADVCAELGVWLHVDGAYGLAALASDTRRSAFTGIERSDSFIVDPHKWLFGPYDSCALLYRDPALARRAHSQSADYLDVINERNDWNPADYAVHLSRRARGLPMWFSLAVHGTDAYGDGDRSCSGVDCGQTVAEIRQRPELELVVEPDLSVLLFRRLGWNDADYLAWSNASDRVRHGIRGPQPGRWEIGRADGVAESAHDDRGCGRWCWIRCGSGEVRPSVSPIGRAISKYSRSVP